MLPKGKSNADKDHVFVTPPAADAGKYNVAVSPCVYVESVVFL